ncbi:MAG: hypothetical protein AAF850_06680, partial [Pseudomonadota bacterium]
FGASLFPNNSPFQEIDSLALGTGYSAGGAVGYAFDVSRRFEIRVEGEGAFSSFGSVGSANAVTGMANIKVVQNFKDKRISLYAGGGAGAARLRFDGEEVFVSTEILDAIVIGILGDANVSSTEFAWQAFGGLETKVTKNLSVFAEGRYQRFGSSDIFISSAFSLPDFDVISEEELTIFLDQRIENAQAVFGLRVSF